MDTTMTTIDTTTPTGLLAPLTSADTPATPPTPPRIPTEGDKVLYVLDAGRSHGEVRPAFVVKNWNKTAAGAVNLCIFTDFTNDFYPEHRGADGTLWRTSVPYSANKEPGTWHWGTEA